MDITYFVPGSDTPLGGIKVLYRHSQALNAMGHSSFVFHPDHPNFTCTWFEHAAKIRPHRNFSAEREFIVIPEVWAGRFAKQAIDIGLPYAIFVQNGYLMGAGVVNTDWGNVQRAYENASCILSISDDTTCVISKKFPEINPEKIIRLIPGIGDKFSSATKKKIITYMPRKLERHSDIVRFLLEGQLPHGWSLQAIENRSEAQVAAMLAESSIFLSFCDMEGLPLPPMEAALSGNLVVGYTGQGAKEYFSQPIFREVHNGDFLAFIDAIHIAISDVERGLNQAQKFADQIRSLRATYSSEAATSYLQKFAAHVACLIHN
jgi:hypothetical protein